MAKYTPVPISTTLSNSAATTINNNLTAISVALEKTLSRDGTTPNQMTSDLDINNNDVINVASLDSDLVSTNALFIDGKRIIPTTGLTGLGDADYNSRSDAIAAIVPAPTMSISLIHEGLMLDYVRDVNGTALTTADGGNWSPAGAPFPEHFGAMGDGIADDTQPIQAAIDWLSVINLAAKRGGTIRLRPRIYSVTNLIMKSRVRLSGAGAGVTYLKGRAGATGDMLLIPEISDFIGWDNLSFDGNNGVSSYSNVIHFAPNSTPGGGTFQAWITDKVDNQAGGTKYKHCYAHTFYVGRSSGHGIYIEPSSYQIMFDNFATSYNMLHGLYARCADSIFSNFYHDQNFAAGMYVSGSNNKFSNGKSIFSGRGNNTYGNIYVEGSAHMFVNIEAQDGYCHGWNIGGAGHKFVNVTGNANGIKSFTEQDESSRIHSNFHFRSNCSEIDIRGRSYDYLTAVGSDGFWRAERPYSFDAYAEAQFDTFQIDYDNKYNTAPAYIVSGEHNAGYKIWQQDSFLSIDAGAETSGAPFFIRLFRNMTPGVTARFDVNVPGTGNIQHSLGSGGATLCGVSGNVLIGDNTTGGAWDKPHITMGAYHIWIDTSGRLRIKNSAPSSDTDGTVVGAQS